MEPLCKYSVSILRVDELKFQYAVSVQCLDCKAWKDWMEKLAAVERVFVAYICAGRMNTGNYEKNQLVASWEAIDKLFDPFVSSGGRRRNDYEEEGKENFEEETDLDGCL